MFLLLLLWFFFYTFASIFVCFIFERAGHVTHVESHELTIRIFFIPLTIDQTEMNHISANLVLPSAAEFFTIQSFPDRCRRCKYISEAIHVHKLLVKQNRIVFNKMEKLDLHSL